MNRWLWVFWLLLHAVERFAVLLVALAPDGVRNPGRRHQVALVGRVDEHPALQRTKPLSMRIDTMRRPCVTHARGPDRAAAGG